MKTGIFVEIEGNSVEVEQTESGRYYARLYDDAETFREWHAKSVDVLKKRIEETTNRA